MPKSIQDCLSGQFLYGDDFPPELVETLVSRGNKRCYDIRKTYPAGYTYPYHALRWEHGFRYLPRDKKFNNVLGYGAGPGEEFVPIRSRCGQITIVEPAEGYVNKRSDVPKTDPQRHAAIPK